jgi:hypothetical protein
MSWVLGEPSAHTFLHAGRWHPWLRINRVLRAMLRRVGVRRRGLRSRSSSRRRLR